jgi:hypothetical protein
MYRRFQMGAIAAAVAATLATAPVGHMPTNGLRENRRFASKGSVASRRGRPRKFSRPSRGVTLTLPDDVIEALRAVDSDLSVAVVRMAQSLVPDAPFARAELINYGGRSVIIVPRSQVLKERTGVELVPLTEVVRSWRSTIDVNFAARAPDRRRPCRPRIEGADRDMFEALAEILKNARRSERVEVRQRNIIVLQSTRPAGENGPVVEGDEEPQVASA